MNQHDWLMNTGVPGRCSPTGRGGGRAPAALPLLDDVTTSPASPRLASARPALAPKCELILARTLSGVMLEACNNTMNRRGVLTHDLFPFVVVTESAIGELVLLQSEGYAYVKP